MLLVPWGVNVDYRLRRASRQLSSCRYFHANTEQCNVPHGPVSPVRGMPSSVHRKNGACPLVCVASHEFESYAPGPPLPLFRYAKTTRILAGQPGWGTGPRMRFSSTNRSAARGSGVGFVCGSHTNARVAGSCGASARLDYVRCLECPTGRPMELQRPLHLRCQRSFSSSTRFGPSPSSQAFAVSSFFRYASQKAVLRARMTL